MARSFQEVSVLLCALVAICNSASLPADTPALGARRSAVRAQAPPAELAPEAPFARRGTNLVVYNGAGLQSGFVDWSWGSTINYANTNPLYSGVNSIRVTATNWGALSLHAGTPLAPSVYSAINFWVNPSNTSGTKVQVQASLNGAGQTQVISGLFPANTWTSVSITLAALGVANNANFDGFWIQAGTASSVTFYIANIVLISTSATPPPPPPSPAPATPAATSTLTATPTPVPTTPPPPPPGTATATINAASPVRKVDPRVFGLNVAVWDGSLSTSGPMLQNGGFTALRFPGGSIADTYNFQTDANKWASSFATFANLAISINAQPMITVNYGSGTPQLAAQWVQAAKAYNYPFTYWEVGNEVFGASWETDNNKRPHDPVTYATRFVQYIQQMKAVNPLIKVGAVAIPGEDAYANYASDESVLNPVTNVRHSGWTPMLLSTFKTLGVYPDFLVFHQYPQNPPSVSDSYLLASSTQWKSYAANLRGQINAYIGSAVGAGIELLVTENNCQSYSPDKQSTSLVNGLYRADSVGQLLYTEFNGLMWWDLRNSHENNYNPAGLYGWRSYGDYGIVSPKNGADFYPTFFASRILSYFAHGGDQVVAASSSNRLLGTYAVVQAGGMNLPSQPLVVLNCLKPRASHVHTFSVEYMLYLA